MQEAITAAANYGFNNPVRHYYMSQCIDESEISALKAVLKGSRNIIHDCMNRKAVLAGGDKIVDHAHSLNDAIELVVHAYGDLSPIARNVVVDIIRNNFFTSSDPSVESTTIMGFQQFMPMVILHYLGRWADVREFAHEMGHALHGVLRNQHGHIQAVHSTFIDETCAVFGERLLWNEAKYRGVFGAATELMDADDRMTSICTFEVISEFHNAIIDLCQKGKCSEDTLDKEWLRISRECLGSATEPTDWRKMSRVFSDPFRAIAYVYAQLVAEQLWHSYVQDPEDFRQKYLSFLKQGSSKPPRELLSIFGFDTASPEFWKSALDMIGNEYTENADARLRGQVKPMSVFKPMTANR